MNDSDYILSDGQEYALNAAISLDQPLLLTGEPGTGKTVMAKWAVKYLNKKYGGFYPEVLRFSTKTTSRATDLLYNYDALSHFQAANIKGEQNAATARFIEPMALGKAIALSNPKAEYSQYFRFEMPEKPLHSVVLIDEVDKAPRDFTNDLLDELERYRFEIKEQNNYPVEKGAEAKVVILMTSNSEKNLPDAFLRRCAFFHIEFPTEDRLRKIVEVHLGQVITPSTEAAYKELFDFFHQVREKAVRKKPATAELIAWLKLLGAEGFAQTTDSAKRKAMLQRNLSFLVKTKDDLDAIRSLI